MTTPDLTLGAYSDVPPRPPSEVEWEDLLYRLELMNRALNVALEEVSEATAEVRAVLTEMVERERAVGRMLEIGAFGSLDTDHGSTSASNDYDDASLAHRFIRIRSRNFAMLQRRGLEVWDWRFSVADAEIGIYQLLVGLARADITALAALRETGARKSPC